MTQQNLDPAEIQKFDDHANDWWALKGPLKTLHEINPLRMQYIESKITLTGKKVIDIGCGGGILAESLAKAGALVTAIDMSEKALAAAEAHQKLSGLQIEYLLTTAEDLSAKRPLQYDIVTCLELLEHVPLPRLLIQAAAQLLKPGGHAFFSTLNRNPKSYLFAIIGAEYLLKWLPKQTHDFSKFIRPSELNEWAKEAGLTASDITGLVYRPLLKQFALEKDVSVNYLMQFKK